MLVDADGETELEGEIEVEAEGETDELGETEELGESEREALAEGLIDFDTEAEGEADRLTLDAAGKATRLAPGVKGFQIAVRLITPPVITPVPTVRMMSSFVTKVGKFVAVSAARAAGEAINDL